MIFSEEEKKLFLNLFKFAEKQIKVCEKFDSCVLKNHKELDSELNHFSKLFNKSLLFLSLNVPSLKKGFLDLEECTLNPGVSRDQVFNIFFPAVYKVKHYIEELAKAHQILRYHLEKTSLKKAKKFIEFYTADDISITLLKIQELAEINHLENEEDEEFIPFFKIKLK